MANEFNAQQNAAVPAIAEYVGEMEVVTVRPPADISAMTLTPKDAALLNAMQSLTNEYWELVDGFFRESPNASSEQWTKKFEDYLLNEERFVPILQKNAVALEAIHDHEMHILTQVQQQLRQAATKLQQTCNVAQDNAIAENQSLPADISPRLKQIHALHDSIIRDLQFLGTYRPESELSAEVILLQGMGNQVFAGGKYEEMKASIEMNLPPSAKDRDTLPASTLDYTAMIRVLGDPFTSRAFEARRDETMGRGDFNLLALQDAANLVRDTQDIERSMAAIQTKMPTAQCKEEATPKKPVMIDTVISMYGKSENDPTTFKAIIAGNPSASSNGNIATLLQATIQKIVGGTVTVAVDQSRPDAFNITVNGIAPGVLIEQDAAIRRALHELRNIPTQSVAPTSGVLLEPPFHASLADLGELSLNLSFPKEMNLQSNIVMN